MTCQTCPPITHSHALNCRCNDCWWFGNIPTKRMDQISRLALTAVCLHRGRWDAVIWICGGLMAGVGLGAYYKYLGRPTPAVGGFGSVCGNGIAESISGRHLNRVEMRVLTIFLFWASTHGKHHRETVIIGSIYGGLGAGLNLMDWFTGNEPDVTCAHAAHCA